MDAVRAVLGGDDRARARALGGLLIAVGTVVLLLRRSFFSDPWGDFLVLLVLVVLTEALFWSGFAGARWGARRLSWQAVFLVVAIVLTPLTLYQFLEWIDGYLDAPLNTMWIFLVTALVARLALYGARLRIGALLASLALIVAWVAFWHELLDQGAFDDADTVRWLLFAIAAILLAVAAVVSASGAPEGSGADVVTVAGLAAVVAGGLFAVVPGLLIGPVGLGTESTPTTLWWDIELLVASLALIGLGLGAAISRGPAYIGAFGLLVFTFSVGADLDDGSPAGKVLGWPLILLVLGLGAVAWSALPALRRRHD